MLEFRDITLNDKERITSALKQSDFMGCEYSFANNMAWKRLAESKIAFYRDFYICCAFQTEDDIPHFIFPAGSGDYREVVSEMKRFSSSLGKPLILTGVTEPTISVLNELFPEQFTAEYDRDSSDYIYLSSDLIELKGKKYHSKRNHLAKLRDYTYSPVTEKDFDDCIFFCTQSYNNKHDDPDHSSIAEQYAINTYFSHYEELGLRGGIIRIDGKIAAVTLGEKINSNTFCVHIEKADTSFSGIYAGINKLFAENEAKELKYINREEDLGIEGLRKSKLSYHPAFLLDKYTVTFK
ncbi:MAG: DUF2156 domain-containing protein [Ruminococcus sp.]|nr:DUF2156 domain-containing protein [Ruminococcus sp.]